MKHLKDLIPPPAPQPCTLRWHVKRRFDKHEWGGKRWDTHWDADPVLEFFNGVEWVEVPRVVEEFK
jgi:hypothetical protein